MNIVFLIGNGFDINLDLKTRYNDFYEYYISIPSVSGVIQKLKKDIEKNIQNWSDLEVKFGKHTKYLNSTDEFFEVYEDIEDNLANYLGAIESNFDFSHIDTKCLYDYLAFPENYLPLSDKNKLVTFKNQWSGHQWDIYVITFNYTQTLEKIVNYENKAIQINSQLSIKTPILIQRIDHIHGFIDERMVMGVNDISQVENKDFHNNQEVLESLVKNDCNKAQKHTVDERCRSILSKADLISIFGSSIGDTDKMWWEHIGEQLKRNCRLLIFEKGEIISRRRPQKRVIVERKIRRLFLEKTKLNDKEKEDVSDKIFVSVNSDIFKLS